MLYTKYESSGPCRFRQEDFWKLQFENLFFDPVTYLSNQLERFEQLWLETTQGPFLWSLVKIQWFQRRSRLNEKVNALTHPRTDWRRTKDCHKSSLWAFCVQVSKETYAVRKGESFTVIKSTLITSTKKQSKTTLKARFYNTSYNIM